MAALVIHVRLHDGRYHGRGDWPPSPARLFQALVAGVGLGGPLGVAEKEALKWLESQESPTVAAPRAWQTRRGVLFYMPNNDSDRIEGDPSKMAKIRTAIKIFQPYFFDSVVPFVYVWSVGPAAEDQQNAAVICSLAERLYQLGRGIDMAWAWGEMLDDGESDGLLATHRGQVYRASERGKGIALPAPCRDSLASIESRYRAFGERFSYEKDGKNVRIVFRQPPKARFQLVAYDSPPSRQLYELRNAAGDFAPWPLERAHGLVVGLRDEAVKQLKRAMPTRVVEIDRALVGRKPDGTNDCPPESRVRIIPLPSIGDVHADREIRRVLVETPPACPIRPDDIHWAFSGLDLIGPDPGEVLATLIRTDDESFLRHYGVEDQRAHRVWRTVTPVALPESARRRRIHPARKNLEAKGGAERKQEQVHAAAAVYQALRHADVLLRPEAMRLQREPFERKGERAETFGEGTRFSKHRLWHVEVEFPEAIAGPLLIGDGRFLGLGLMAPTRDAPAVQTVMLTLDSPVLPAVTATLEIAEQVRVRLMGIHRRIAGDKAKVSPRFSGKSPDGRPLQGHQHAFTMPLGNERGRIDRILLLSAGGFDASEIRAILELRELHGIDSEKPIRVAATWRGQADDPQMRPRAKVVVSATPFVASRYWRKGRGTPEDFLKSELRRECRNHGLPEPLTVDSLEQAPGLFEWVKFRRTRKEDPVRSAYGFRVTFREPVPTPFSLGYGCHFGLGQFHRES